MFLFRYKSLYFKKTATDQDPKETCILVLKQMDSKAELHKLGKTKVEIYAIYDNYYIFRMTCC